MFAPPFLPNEDPGLMTRDPSHIADAGGAP
jgi:hypothetical protein